MTYRELLGYAQKKIDNNEITVGEYIEMTKVLNREVDVLDKIRTEIEHLDYLNIEDGSDGYDKYVDQYDVMQIIDKYREGAN